MDIEAAYDKIYRYAWDFPVCGSPEIQTCNGTIEKRKGVYGLLGANGAGKTTLLRMIVGIVGPTKGTISYNGIDSSEEECCGSFHCFLR